MGLPPGEVVAVVATALGVLLALSQRLQRLTRVLVRRAGRAGLRLVRQLGVLPPALERPQHRPIEVIAHEGRRLRQRYRDTRRGVSYAKSEAVRRAYDDVLAEGCDALGIAHLLGVIEDAAELDVERRRVERLLHVWGLDLDSPPEAA